MSGRRSKCSATRSHRRGAATVEMAFVAPVIILLVFGSIEFARMMMVRQALTNAAREGCRHACLATTFDDQSAIDVMIETLAGVVINKSNPDVLRATIEPSFAAVPESGTKFVATVEVDCADVSWLPPVFYSGAKIRVASSAIRE